MYRSSRFLSKPAILSSRYNPTQTRKLLNKYGSVIKNNSNNYGRRMSTRSKAKWENRLYWGYSAAAGILFCSSVTLLSKHNDEFRKAIEDGIPISKYFFNYILPKITVLPPEDEGESEDDDVLVVNIMDTPTASQIDFEVVKKHDVVTDNEILVEGEHVSEEIIHGAEKEGAEKNIEGAVELNVVDAEVEGNMILAEEFPDTLLEKEISDVEESVIIPTEEPVKLAEDILVPSESLEDITDELQINISPFAGTSLADDREVVDQKSLITFLSHAYENLRITLDDTVTTKTSAIGTLNGYITQFGQALMINKEDPAYDSIWEAAAVLERNVQESIDLVEVKEAEVNLLMKKIVDAIHDIRKFGVSDLADKAEALVASSSESLLLGESEIEIATNKLNFLHGFQKRVEGCPQKLQEYLEDFKPDLIKLLNLQQDIDAQNLSSEDVLLMLSLQRPELIYGEVHQKEVEQKKQFEAIIEQQKEDLIKEADQNCKIEMENLAAHKDCELKLKVEELNELHENHLQEELKMLSKANQEELESTIAKHEAELTSQHEEEMTQKLNEQDDKHSLEVLKNLSYLKGIQSKVMDIVDVSDQQRRNQDLWVAAQALTTALSTSLDNGRTRSLMPAISNLLQCNNNDDVLATIIATVPKGAANLGIIPENALIQRFIEVKRVCKRMAMVKDGGSILNYTFSYIKSFFVISRFYQRHITDDIDLDTIGPYGILEKADYYIQQGDLVQAAKFMSQLKGVSRKLCDDWLKEVRLLLETKQSANLLMAYAGSFIAGSE